VQKIAVGDEHVYQVIRTLKEKHQTLELDRIERFQKYFCKCLVYTHCIYCKLQINWELLEVIRWIVFLKELFEL